MSNKKFSGGIHTYYGKELTRGKSAVLSPEDGEFVFPLAQHIGAAAAPCVGVGERVLVGQIIAEASGFVSANVISSVSGSVKAIEERTLLNASRALCIVIDNDGRYEWAEDTCTARDASAMSDEEILSAVKRAGIVGLGGAGFPTHVKLAPKEPDKIDHVIINASECEPYLTSDELALLERGERVIAGARYVLSLFPNARCIIGIEDNKREAAEHMRELCAGQEKISVEVLKTKYPQGAERNIIYSLTGRELKSSLLPADLGCIVINVNTACAIADAVDMAKPLTRKTLTVTGDSANEPKNVDVPLGISFSRVLAFAGGARADTEKIICGGPMMGISIAELNAPVVKTSSALLCLSRDEAVRYEEKGCIMCGRCIDACPEKLMPLFLNRLARKEDYEGFLRYDGMECVDCGCCAYVCPARIRINEGITGMKGKMRAYLKQKNAGGEKK